MQNRSRIADTYPWWEEAACRSSDVELFYSDEPERRAMALALCASCPVRTDCREAARASGEHFGVWGGQTETQRRRDLRAEGRRGAA